MQIFIKFHEYLWILPFTSFIIGYALISVFFHTPIIKTPALIGKNIAAAVLLLSCENLNLRILGQKEDNDLPEGTIITQSPAAHQAIKSNQTIFCVVSKQSEKLITPNLIGMQKEEILSLLKQKRIPYKEYILQSNYPKDTCIAQIPNPGTPLQKSIILYFSGDDSKPVLLPSFKELPIDEVIKFLDGYNLKPKIFHTLMVDSSHQCQNCTVINQKPLPGSLVDISKPLNIQLQVR
ncbi:MAG: PASTA domain-containing protein [Candidatus Babeliales bacterium]